MTDPRLRGGTDKRSALARAGDTGRGAAQAASPVVGPSRPRLLGILGPGLITGASSDDPSGIATYSQAGAQFGFGGLWLMLYSYPLVAVMQEISARIGRSTGQGLAGALRRHYPPWLIQTCIALLLVANVINLGADLGAMGAVVAMMIGGPQFLYAALFGGACLALQVMLHYTRYVSAMKWASLALLAYFGTALIVRVPWGEAAFGFLVPTFTPSRAFLSTVLAVLGTTISPYLFFWQSSQEAEDLRVQPLRGPLLEAPQQARRAFRRIRLDTYIGMGFSNLTALAIMVTTAATLHVAGAGDIQTAQQAAEALRPVAGRFASLVFAVGIVGTGLLGVPVLAGSAAYVIGEARLWPVGLSRRFMEARAFYGTLAVATALGAILNALPVDPIRALYWSAVVNGAIAAPIMGAMMQLASNRAVMGRFTLPLILKAVGWVATAVMGLSTLGLIATVFV